MKWSCLAGLLPLTVVLACTENAAPTGSEPDLLPAGEPEGRHRYARSSDRAAGIAIRGYLRADEAY
jgi:hypothetical protein